MIKKIMTMVQRMFKGLWAGVKGCWCGMAARHRKRLAKRQHERLVEESRSRIQVMAWDGAIYLCVDGMPLLSESDLDYCLSDQVELARENWVCYHETKTMGGKYIEPDEDEEEE